MGKIDILGGVEFRLRGHDGLIFGREVPYDIPTNPIQIMVEGMSATPTLYAAFKARPTDDAIFWRTEIQPTLGMLQQAYDQLGQPDDFALGIWWPKNRNRYWIIEHLESEGSVKSKMVCSVYDRVGGCIGREVVIDMPDLRRASAKQPVYFMTAMHVESLRIDDGLYTFDGLAFPSVQEMCLSIFGL